MKIKRVIFFILLPFFLYAQKPKKLIEAGEKACAKKAYAEAIVYFENAKNKIDNLRKEDQTLLLLHLGDCYFKLKNEKMSEKYYFNAFSQSTIFDQSQVFHLLQYAKVLSSQGKYLESSNFYKKYTSLSEQDKRGKDFANLYTNLDPLTRNSGSYKLDYLGVNSSAPDFSPTLYKDGIVFVSGRSKALSLRRIFSWDLTNFLDLYILEKSEIEKFEHIENTSELGHKLASNLQNTSNQVEKLGNDYYTPKMPNDSKKIGQNQNEYVNTELYSETPSLIATIFSKKLNSKYHEGPCTFLNENFIIFTRNSGDEKKGEMTRLKLYSAERQPNSKEWSNVKELTLNDGKNNFGHPSFSAQNQTLYFVSDMPSGFGGTDIYFSKYENGRWSNPVNLGSGVNTIGDEMFPYIDSDGGLYFSSDGWPGIGNLDLFFLKTDPETSFPKGKARNVGAPLNSAKDDFGIITDSERKVGYLSSNRKRGGADIDLYRFIRTGSLYGCKDMIITSYDKKKSTLTKEPIAVSVINLRTSEVSRFNYTNGSVQVCLNADTEYTMNFKSEKYENASQKLNTFQVSDFATTYFEVYLEPKAPEKKIVSEVYSIHKKIKNQKNIQPNLYQGRVLNDKKQSVANAEIKVKNHCNNQEFKILSDGLGNYSFSRNPGCDYSITISQPDYLPLEEKVNKIKRKPNSKKVLIVDEIIKLENIYYKNKEYDLNQEVISELKRIAESINKTPNMLIEITSHTDSHGSNVQNLSLSRQRAEYISRVFEKAGISKNNIRTIGKGEQRLLNNCTDNVQCTESEHQKNRRTEIKVKKLKFEE